MSSIQTNWLWCEAAMHFPCTSLGCLLMLKNHIGDLSGKDAVVVGKPMATFLTRGSCAVTIAHSRIKDLPSVFRSADILITAVGEAKMTQWDWINNETVVIDVGINRIPAPERGEGKMQLVGDANFEEVKQTQRPSHRSPIGLSQWLLQFYSRMRYKLHVDAKAGIYQIFKVFEKNVIPVLQHLYLFLYQPLFPCECPSLDFDFVDEPQRVWRVVREGAIFLFPENCLQLGLPHRSYPPTVIPLL